MPLTGSTVLWVLKDKAKKVARHEQTRLVIIAIATGIAAALGATAFRELLGLIQWVWFGEFGDLSIETVQNLAWWQRLLVPTMGGLIVGYFIYKFVPEKRPMGVPQVMEASALHGANMSLRDGVRGAIANAATLGFGGSAGREGPVVHLGATIGAKLARLGRLPRDQARVLLACGVAGAVAA